MVQSRSPRLIRNAILTPDGTLLESRHRHDYRTHKDANGFEYMVDGGLEYGRRGWSPDAPEYTDASVYLEDGIEKVREAASWGTRGKDGTEPLRQVLLKDMSDAHVQACLDTQPMMHPHYREAFQLELEYRKQNGITVSDV